ncbi:MAG: segregation/condensation protein A [Deltaproteobacteria bacterium]|nr:segregation/condensation protein A [Deltaproteobacteria bacterium]
MTDYRVKLPSFEGPLDLLLHLVRKNEYDIFDIPIAEITEQYLGFLELMSELNLEFASDYLVMAATLVKIKSALLLPRPAEDDEDAEDPRDELVRQILEYERFREASYDIEQRPQLGRDVFARTFPARELEEARREPGYLQVSIFDLMTAFRAVLSRTPGRNVTIIAQERYSIRERMTQITEILSERRSLLFGKSFRQQDG